MALDRLDIGLIAYLRGNPRATISELARELVVARGTVQTRLERLEARGVITGFGPDVDGPAAGFGVMSFTTLEIAQGTHGRIVAALSQIPEILEVHTVTGPGDLLCRIVARSNDHLHEVLQRIVAIGDVTRTETHLALNTEWHKTVADLLATMGV